MNLRHRVISQEAQDYIEANEPGLARLGRRYGWRVADDDHPADLTLAMFGIQPPGSIAPYVDDLPSLEQYIAAGYPAENYDSFVERYREERTTIDTDAPALVE